MDGLADDDVASVDVHDVVHLHYKDGEHSSQKPENSEMRESQETVAEGTAKSSECPFSLLTEMFEEQNPSSTDLRGLCDEQHHHDEGAMVEELTVRSFDGADLATATNGKDKLDSLQQQWWQLCRPLGGSRSGSLHGTSSSASSSHGLFESDSSGSRSLKSGEKKIDCDRGIKTKVLSKSGFSEFFVKTTLKSKGITFRGLPHDGPKSKSLEGDSAISDEKVSPDVTLQASTICQSGSKNPTSYGKPSHLLSVCNAAGKVECEGINLRDWLKSDNHRASKAERLYIFKCIVDLVDSSHAKGIVVYRLCPSSYIMHQGSVKYIWPTHREEALDRGSNNDKVAWPNASIMKRAEESLVSAVAPCAKKQKLNVDVKLRNWSSFSPICDIQAAETTDAFRVGKLQHHGGPSECSTDVKYKAELSSMATTSFGSVSECIEDQWYISPEELNEGNCTVSSNIYSLGMLLFELLGQFASERARAVAMSDLRYRILPPDFLSENPKEAGFCLWLLHPQPFSRPTTMDILRSGVVGGLQQKVSEEFSTSIEQENEESELLLHFLLLLLEQKQKHASKLAADVKSLESDISEIARRRTAIYSRDKCHATKPSISGPVSKVEPISNEGDPRLMNNINHLESVYFSMRAHINLPDTYPNIRPDCDVLKNPDNCLSGQESVGRQNSGDRIGAFFDGLCKYARYNKFEMRGIVRTGELNNSANVICSMSFDKDEDYFAAAGVSKKIKIFEFNSLYDKSVDIPYPVIEMPNRSKLSCVRWNSYIKNYLASSDYDGTVKLWDVSTGQAISEYSEHEKRAWSVDFAPGCPMKFASGSDDCTVKLWSINERKSLGTIKKMANVCSVQFSTHSPHLLAFGSAEYRAYCYDLRNLRAPWCVLAGHNKAVSYVKFVDSETLVTASTDNTLKLWDLNKTSHGGYSNNACSLTFRGHTNEMNFVGLSTLDGYIACGSETNEVYAYYRSLPMPITSYKFGSIDPISGKDIDDDKGFFVSSVCWGGKSDTIIAANSSGCIKVLQLV